MEFVYSTHWYRKRRYRKEIEPYLIEYAIQNSKELPDKHWEDLSNALCRIPWNGRTIKVVYKRIGKNQLKIITAFWLD